MKYAPGDDVTVCFDGVTSRGEVLDVGNVSGYVFCRIHPDPEMDYSSIPPRIYYSPSAIVAVPDKKVKHLEET